MSHPHPILAIDRSRQTVVLVYPLPAPSLSPAPIPHAHLLALDAHAGRRSDLDRWLGRPAARRAHRAASAHYATSYTTPIPCDGDAPTGLGRLAAAAYAAARSLRSICPPAARIARELAYLLSV